MVKEQNMIMPIQFEHLHAYLLAADAVNSVFCHFLRMTFVIYPSEKIIYTIYMYSHIRIHERASDGNTKFR